jgi:hypothetical protein
MEECPLPLLELHAGEAQIPFLGFCRVKECLGHLCVTESPEVHLINVMAGSGS